MRYFLIVFILLFPLAAFAQVEPDPTTFQWDVSTSEPLGAYGGYCLYKSKNSGQYDETKIVGCVGEGVDTYTMPNKPGWGRWYFVVDAFAADGPPPEMVVRSGYSNEVSKVFKPNSPTNLATSVSGAIVDSIKKTGSVFASLFKRGDLRITR